MQIRENLPEQYRQFCASPLNTNEAIDKDLFNLLHNEGVAEVRLYQPDILMVGTKPIVIAHEDSEYYIGDFIIFLVRRRTHKIWETSFCFSNPTGSILIKGKDDESYFVMHPHIVEDEKHPDIKMPVGWLCISHGQIPIYQALREGRINDAVSRLLAALQSYEKRSPYQKIEYWPLQQRETEHA